MSAVEGKYGIITAEKKQFHPDERIFLLRAADPLAGTAVRAYAKICEGAGCSKEHVKAIYEQAVLIEEWQIDNPALVKALPD